MPAFGKMVTAALGAAALSGTLFVPSSRLMALPAPELAAAATSGSDQIIAAPAAQPAPQVEQAPRALQSVPAVETAETSDGAPQQEEAGTRLSQSEVDCMTKVILYEAGAESRAGQVAVAQVVMNRAKSGRFRNSVCGVIYQPGQFSSIRSYKTPGGARRARAEAIARAVMTGDEVSAVGKALYFHATRVRPAYVRSRTRVATIGNHVFYR